MNRPRAETQPLFGEKKTEAQLFVWISLGACQKSESHRRKREKENGPLTRRAAVLALAAVEAITVAIVYGILNKQADHFSLALVVLVASVLAGVLYRWHSKGGAIACCWLRRSRVCSPPLRFGSQVQVARHDQRRARAAGRRRHQCLCVCQAARHRFAARLAVLWLLAAGHQPLLCRRRQQVQQSQLLLCLPARRLLQLLRPRQGQHADAVSDAAGLDTDARIDLRASVLDGGRKLGKKDQNVLTMEGVEVTCPPLARCP